MLHSFDKKTLPQVVSIMPVVVKEFEKCIVQPTQIPAVTEGLAAACLLLKFASLQLEKESSFNSLWNTIFDMEKQIFISEKFITTASDNGKIMKCNCIFKYFFIY